MAPGESTDQPTDSGLWQSTAALVDLTFTRAILDRCAEERSDARLLDRLLVEEASRVISLRAGRFAVTESSSADRSNLSDPSDPTSRTLTLAQRPPEGEDRGRLVVFLGRSRHAVDTSGTGASSRSVGRGVGRGVGTSAGAGVGVGVGIADEAGVALPALCPSAAVVPGLGNNRSNREQGQKPGESGRAASTAPAWLGVVEEGEVPADAVTGVSAPVSWQGLRSIAVRLAPEEATIAATLSALANWHATHQHCPRCGAVTLPVQGGWVRHCPKDGSQHFPRTDPAVIMAVTDADDRLLLARGSGFTSTGMSVLAGFVEPGESLTQAVIREVEEEVGLQVADVDYLGDQPWPFPHGIMVGFRARALTTDVRTQDGEIEEARWFTRAEFDEALADGTLHISGRLSIARRLIEHWYGAPLDVADQMLRR